MVSLFRRLMLLGSVGCVSLSMQGTQAPPGERFVLERGRAGPFQVGMTVAEIEAIAGRDNVRAVTSNRAAESRPALDVRVSSFTSGPAVRILLERILRTIGSMVD